jgi:hypothetical protein
LLGSAFGGVASDGLLGFAVLGDALEPPDVLGFESLGFAADESLLGFESLGVADPEVAGEVEVCDAFESLGVALVVGAAAAEPAVAPAPGAGALPSSEPQPSADPASTNKVNEQDASVRAYVLVMECPRRWLSRRRKVRRCQSINHDRDNTRFVRSEKTWRATTVVVPRT